MSAEAHSTMLERLEDDPTFVLSLSEPPVGDYATEEDARVDGDVFEDDLAIPAASLAKYISGSQDDADASCSNVTMDDEGNIEIRSGLDDELTDNDAEGETDPDFDMDDNSALVVGAGLLNENKLGLGWEWDVSIIPVWGKKLKSQAEALLDKNLDHDGRYANTFL
jgi:hypothetical protein